MTLQVFVFLYFFFSFAIFLSPHSFPPSRGSSYCQDATGKKREKKLMIDSVLESEHSEKETVEHL